jgi:uncharacterized membrane protein YfbV (UPF0208 family)
MQQEQPKHGRRLAPALIAVGAAAAGYYFYGSKNAARNRAQAAKWAKEMKGEVMRKVRTLPRIDEKTVTNLVNAAAASYEKVRSIRKADVARAAKELRDNWQRLVGESRAGKGRKTRAKARPKSAKKTVRRRKG